MRIVFDALVKDEKRERQLSITNEAGGFQICDGDPLFQVGVRPLMGACLTLIVNGKNPLSEWAKRCLASLPGSG